MATRPLRFQQKAMYIPTHGITEILAPSRRTIDRLTRQKTLLHKKVLLNQEGQEVKFDENWLLTEPSKDKFIAQVLFNTLETVIAY